MDDLQPFWRTKRLAEMSESEWESLCDGCARCCLVKLEDEDTAEIHYTDVRCRLLDGESCRCMDYPNRQAKVPDCVKLTPAEVEGLDWLPPTCAYRLIGEGRGLAWWHPLVSGDPATVKAAGVSVSGRTFASEDDLTIAQQMARIKGWPKRWPKAARRAGPGEG